MFKKILIGIGVAVVALTTLGASDCEVESDASTSEAPPAAEAPAATEAPAAVEPEECSLTASCPLTNGWTVTRWDSDVAALTPSLEAQYGGLAALAAGCMVDVVMTAMSPNEFDALNDAEYETLAANLLHQCQMGEIRVP